MSLLSKTSYGIEGLLFNLPDSSDTVGVVDDEGSIPIHEFATSSSGSFDTPHQHQQQMTAATLMIVLALSEIFVIVVCRMLSSYHDAFYAQYRAEDLAFFLSTMNMPGGNDLNKRKEVVESALVHEHFHRGQKMKLLQQQPNPERQAKNIPNGKRDSFCCVCDDAAEESCPICLVDYDEGDSISHTQNCAHCFHESCVTQWLMNHDTCPCCRTNAFSSCQKDQRQQETETTNVVGVSEEQNTETIGRIVAEPTTPMSVAGDQEERRNNTGVPALPTENTVGQSSWTRQLFLAFGLPIERIERGAMTISRQSSFVGAPSTDNDDNNGGGLLEADNIGFDTALFM